MRDSVVAGMGMGMGIGFIDVCLWLLRLGLEEEVRTGREEVLKYGLI